MLKGIREADSGDFLGRDFINFWSGGHAVLDGKVKNLYDLEQYRNYLLVNFKPPLNNYNFSYPPHSLLFFSIFGALPYIWGLALWTFGALAFAYFSCRQWALQWQNVMVVTIGPAAIIAVFSGQTGIWLVAIWMMSLALLDERPIISGILIGVLTIKPQIGVLLAIYLICGGYWKVISSTIITTLILIGVSIVFFGIQPWLSFIQETMPHQSKIIAVDYGIFDHMVHTPFKWVINLRMNVSVAWILQSIYMVSAIAIMIWASLRAVDRRLQLAVLSVLTFLFSPYMVIYDMTLIAFAICLYIEFKKDHDGQDWNDFTSITRLTILSLILTPYFGVFMSTLNIPFSVLLMMSFIAILIVEIRKYEQLRGFTARANIT